MTTVSVVIPTVGRHSLDAAVASALDQSHPVAEVLVMVDVAETVEVTSDDPRVRVIPVGNRTGGASARQRGVEAAAGDVIALLDDDDLWHPDKIRQQLEFVPNGVRDLPWLASCRTAVQGPGRIEQVWPRRLITPREPVLDYLFGMSGPRFGGSMLQTSTLCFPREIALATPFDSDPDVVHDEPTWLYLVQKALPEVRIYQSPECLAVYTVTDGSLSKTKVDDSEAYIEWGKVYLSTSTRRIRGDYFLTSPVSAAASVRSTRGVINSVRAGFRHGRPGPGAVAYATRKFIHTLLPAGSRE